MTFKFSFLQRWQKELGVTKIHFDIGISASSSINILIVYYMDIEKDSRNFLLFLMYEIPEAIKDLGVVLYGYL